MATEEFPRKQMETLWAPWRVEYFEKEPRDRNFLEAAARASNDAEHFVITRAELSSLGENEVIELWNLVVHAQTLLRAATRAQGFNIGLNIGECAGAGVLDHLHIHIVPRWSGDTNFMPIIAGTRVLSEGLHALYDKLMDVQAKMAGGDP